MWIIKISTSVFCILLMAGTILFAQEDSKPKFFNYEDYASRHILYERTLGFGFSGGVNYVTVFNDQNEVGYLGSGHLTFLFPIRSHVTSIGIKGVYQYGKLVNSTNFPSILLGDISTYKLERNYSQFLGGVTIQFHPSYHSFTIALNFLAGKFEFRDTKENEIILYPTLELKFWLSRGSSLDLEFGGVIPIKKKILNDPIYDARIGFSFYLVSDYDKDSDGIPDDLDQCQNTSPGEISNEDGCSLSQLDSDSDGIMDDKDKCPDTPPDVSVDSSGCPFDSDEDLIPDYLDVCPDTPVDLEVDSFGCPFDEDSDGVPDKIDECAGTPIGETVNEFGCSRNQIDFDLDGIPDSIDVNVEQPETYNFFEDEDGNPDNTIYPEKYDFNPPVEVFEIETVTLTKDVEGSLIIELVSLYEDYPNTSWVVDVNSSKNAEEKAKIIKQFIDNETGNPDRTRIEYSSSGDENIYLLIDKRKARTEALEKLGLSD